MSHLVPRGCWLALEACLQRLKRQRGARNHLQPGAQSSKPCDWAMHDPGARHMCTFGSEYRASQMPYQVACYEYAEGALSCIVFSTQ